MTTRNTYYLYTDATLHPIFKKNKVVADHGIPYIGGLITDNHGKINNTLIKKNITYIEAMAIEIGLEHANEMGIKNIVCTTDSSNCVYMIQKILMNQKINTYSKNPFNEKFYDIIAIADEFFNSFEIRHMKRDNNHYADLMASYLPILNSNHNDKIKSFKQLLNSCLLQACSYDLIKEKKEYDKEKQQLLKLKP